MLFKSIKFGSCVSGLLGLDMFFCTSVTPALMERSLCAAPVLCALTMPATMGLQAVNGTSAAAEMQIVMNFQNEGQAFFSDVSCAKKLVHIALGLTIAS